MGGCKPREKAARLTDIPVVGYLIDQKMQRAIQSTKNIDEFIKHADLKEYRKNAIIMTGSQSIQAASPQYPRVIMFSDDYKTLVSVESLPTLQNSQQVEVIQYNKENHGYEFYEAQLGQKYAIHNMTGNDKCSSCHHGAPIWEPYDFWPGSIPRASVCRTEAEKDYFVSDDFKNNTILNDLNLGCTTSNNLKLADGLRNSHHFDYVSRRIQRLKNYQKLKFAVMAAMMDCPNIENFNKGLEGYNPDRISTVRREAEDSFKKMDKDIYDLMVRDSLGVSADVAVGLAYLLFDQGIDFSGLFMSFESKYFISPLQGQLYTLLKSFIEGDPVLAGLPLYRVWVGNKSMLFGMKDEVKFSAAKKQSSDIEKIQFSEWGISDYFADSKRWDNIEKHAGVSKACETLQTLSQSAILGNDTNAKIKKFNGWYKADEY